MIKTQEMNAFQFFTESLEYKRTPSGRTEDYNEGYADPIDSILYAIRSGDAKNLFELDEIIQYMDASAGDFSGEFGEGYRDSVDYILKQFSSNP